MGLLHTDPVVRKKCVLHIKNILAKFQAFAVSTIFNFLLSFLKQLGILTEICLLKEEGKYQHK